MEVDPMLWWSVIIIILVLVLALWGENLRDKERIAKLAAEKAEELRQNQITEEYESALSKYNQRKLSVNIPENERTVRLTKNGADPRMRTGFFFIWITDGKVCFFPNQPSRYNFNDFLDIDKYGLPFTVPLSQIDYYELQGEVFRETKISGGGGGGGGSSLGGAIVGGVIAGDTGAIIGSRKKVKINEVKSEVITHDTRETILNYYDANNELRTLYFIANDYQTFQKLIPEKSFNIVSTVNSTKIINQQLNQKETSSIYQQLTELSKLKEQGIITEEEFSEKKQILLSKIE